MTPSRWKLRTYLVEVEYREPTYELAAGRKAEPYRWTFRVDAQAPARAADRALREFEETRRLSSVGWAREVTNVEVVEVEPE